MPERLGGVLQESMLADHFLCNPSEHTAGRDEKREDKLRALSNSSENRAPPPTEGVWCLVTGDCSEAHRSGIHAFSTLTARSALLRRGHYRWVHRNLQLDTVTTPSITRSLSIGLAED